jgi:glucokinase
MSYVIGIDFGATRIKIGVVSSTGEVLSKRVIATPRNVSPHQFVHAVKTGFFSLLGNSLKRKNCIGMGVGVPGLVNTDRGTVQYLVNVKGWRDVPLASLLKRQMGLAVRVDNDVNAMTLGELAFGSGRGCRNLVCLTLGTGVGGGIVIDGKLYRGVSFSAGEVGHVSIHEDGTLCACGGVGCVETYVGNRRIIELAQAKLKEKKSLLNQWVNQGAILTPRLIVQAARKQDTIAVEIWKEIGTHLGVALASVVNLLNPEKIVIGGGVANAGDLLLDVVRKTVKERAMKGPADSVRIVKAQLGEDAGIVGAAVLAGVKGGSQ